MARGERSHRGATALLAHVFWRATGIDIEEYAARHLFAPLGIRAWFWKRAPNGLTDTEGGLYLAAGDLAKLWYLFPRRYMGGATRRESRLGACLGRAGERHDAAYVGGSDRVRSRVVVDRDPLDSTRVVWGGNGYGGQIALAVPDEDLIVVINPWNIIRSEPRLTRDPRSSASCAG